MKKYIIEIPDMQSAHCRTRVANATEKTEGAAVHSIEPGRMEVMLEDEEVKDDVIELIENLGYPVGSVHTDSAADRKVETHRFKTNINCSGCMKKVQPFLDGAEGICEWTVDLNSREKTLEVQAIGLTEKDIAEQVKKAGFQIERSLS